MGTWSLQACFAPQRNVQSKHNRIQSKGKGANDAYRHRSTRCERKGTNLAKATYCVHGSCTISFRIPGSRGYYCWAEQMKITICFNDQFVSLLQTFFFNNTLIIQDSYPNPIPIIYVVSSECHELVIIHSIQMVGHQTYTSPLNSVIKLGKWKPIRSIELWECSILTIDYRRV